MNSGDLGLTSQSPQETNSGGKKSGLDDPRALEILTTEHWSLLSTRALGYQEMFARATIFIAILSGTVVALALLAQATQFSRETLWAALLLIPIDLFIGIATFIRSVEINFEDARWVTGMSLLRGAYLKMVPDLKQFFITAQKADAQLQALGRFAPAPRKPWRKPDHHVEHRRNTELDTGGNDCRRHHRAFRRVDRLERVDWSSRVDCVGGIARQIRSAVSTAAYTRERLVVGIKPLMQGRSCERQVAFHEFLDKRIGHNPQGSRENSGGV